jgi:hypothetical protein
VRGTTSYAFDEKKIVEELTGGGKREAGSGRART